MTLQSMMVDPSNIAIGAGGGAVAGYASGRVVKMAVQVVKWLIAIFVGIQVTLDQMGVITIHFDRAAEVMRSWFGVTGLESFMSTITDIIFSWVPMAGGFGAGFYAGYKKMLF